jgi:hypothetical protein
VLIVLLSLLGKEYDGRTTKNSKNPAKESQ